MNFNLQRCSELRGYVFMRCGDRNLESEFEYWGNIRFAVNSAEAAQDDIVRSALRNVYIRGAGRYTVNAVNAVNAVIAVIYAES